MEKNKAIGWLKGENASPPIMEKSIKFFKLIKEYFNDLFIF